MSVDRIKLAMKIKAHRKLAKQVYPSAKINYEWYMRYKNATNLQGIYDRICTDYRGLLSILKEIVYDLKRETLIDACRSIDTCVNYTGDNEKLSKIVQGIAAVCRAEREGNGEYSEEEVLDNIKFAIQKLKDVLEGKMNEVNDLVQSDNGFSDWFYELEGFAFRRERFQNDVELCTFQQDCEYTWSQMRKWVEAAYQAGYERGRNK